MRGAAAAVAGSVATVFGVLLMVDWVAGIFGHLILALPGVGGLLLYSLLSAGIVWGPILLVVGLGFFNEAWWTREIPTAWIVVLSVVGVVTPTIIALYGFAFIW